MKKLLLPLFIILSAFVLNAQNATLKWTVPADQLPGHIKAFQENKGQFVNTVNNWTVLYGANSNGTEILLTTKGIIYNIPERVKMTDEEVASRENREGAANKEQEEEETKYKTIYHSVVAEWMGASAQPNVEAIGKTAFYFGAIKPGTNQGIDNISGYKEIVYHDIYPGVDIDFTFHPTEGIKYALKVKPGYDASAYKMQFSGNDGLSIDANGNLHIKTVRGDIIDHAPATMQDGKQIPSSFTQLSNNEIGFNVKNANSSSLFTIDPWTVSPLLANTIETDIGADAANNIYVLEWDTLTGETYEQKYNPSGSLLWTYNYTEYGAQSMVSDLAVDPTGNSYVSQPYYYANGGGESYALVALTPAGTLLYFYNTYNNSDGAVFETWNLEYSNKYHTLVESGAPTVTQQQVGIINSSTGSFTGSLFQDASISEIYSGAIAPNGNYYGISSNYCFCNSGAGAYTEQLEAFNVSGTTPSLLWHVPIPRYNFQDFEIKNPGGKSLGGVAMNAIVAGNSSIYTTNGKYLYKFNITSGALQDSAVISGGVDTLNINGGLALDTCDQYLYVGNQNSVMVYDANTLAFNTSYTTPGIVYDMVLNNDLLTVCGNPKSGAGFIEQYSISACTPLAVNNVVHNASFNIYPNPSNGMYTVSTDMGKGIIEVYNTLGQQVLNKTISGTQTNVTLDLSSYPNGAYCVRLISGQKTMSKTVIKK